MKLQFNGLWAVLLGLTTFLLVSCSNGSPSSSATTKNNGRILSGAIEAPLTGTNTSTGTGGGNTSGGNTIATAAPLEFSVEGVGNHAQHICIPAQSKLRLRIKPHQTSSPLLPVDTKLKYPDGTLVYDGTPALYNQLRVRLEIQGTAAAWDYQANNESYSTVGDYSSYLRQVPEGTLDPTTGLKTPEYTDLTILGSDPMDGECTYWEFKLGKCSAISSDLRIHEIMPCPAGQQKILVSKIVADYPCNNDKVNWCKGYPVQTVPDYLRWSVTVEAVTENTKVAF